jgi:hypothetical protein
VRAIMGIFDWQDVTGMGVRQPRGARRTVASR